MIRSIIIAIALTATSSYLIAGDQSTVEDPLTKALFELDWKGTGTYKLPGSHSTLSLPANHFVVVGKDAERGASSCGYLAATSVEAITLNTECSTMVIFENYSEGYVSLNDWEKIDAKQLLEDIKEAKKNRCKNEIKEPQAMRWAQEPSLDRQTNTVSWAIETDEDDVQIVDSVALQLSRHGFELVSWWTKKPYHVPLGEELNVMIHSHSFDQGHRYTDYTKGDEIASYGIADLVAARTGAKTGDDPYIKALFELDWKGTGTYKLPQSHSTLSLPVDHLVVLGKDAERFSLLNGNIEDKSLEAIAIDPEFQNTIYFHSYTDGYVSLSDWGKIDSKQLLEDIKETTEEENKERCKKGIGELHVTGWMQEPSLDRQTNTVYWTIEGDEKGIPIVNSVALRLSRHGFEKFVWATTKSLYKPLAGELDVMLHSHSFDQGHRYADYTSGDNTASYGIAALVAATIGIKVAKAGGFIILFKKIGGFLAAGVAAIFYRIRRLINKKKKGGNSNG